MMPDQTSGDFSASLSRLLDPAMDALAAQLRSVTGLERAEGDVIVARLRDALTETLLRKVNRVLLLELNAARIMGTLTAPDPAGRWQEWLDATTQPRFWPELGEHYPMLVPRLSRVIDDRTAAALALGTRFAADRADLAKLPVAGDGNLTGVSFGAGDSHHHGQTVALLRLGSDENAGRVVYKPRPVEVDIRLAEFLEFVCAETSDCPIRVPQALRLSSGYGWTEFITHRYCDTDAELGAFYRNIGHWLAVSRLIGGSDLHAENLIAAGPVPIVVDCETLFTPYRPHRSIGVGDAFDHVAELLSDSVLRTGLLPGRGVALGWRGVDSSAIGSLPGQQMQTDIPVIVGAGTDTAHFGSAPWAVPMSENHPSHDPQLGRYWDRVTDGFVTMTARMRELDRSGRLEPMLRGFADCQVRVVLRSTETYMELSRMLWHPVSLHDETTARAKAADILRLHAVNEPVAPAESDVIEAEVDELYWGDVPVFETTPRRGLLDGPGGTSTGVAQNLVDDALSRWRTHDHELDRKIIASTLVAAYLNEGYLPTDKPLSPTARNLADLDARRRRMAAQLIVGVRDCAFRGQDGTATWIAPVMNKTGWAVQAMSTDLYGGLAGVAWLLGCYQYEVEAGRADPVDGVGDLLTATMRTLIATENADATRGTPDAPARPDQPGGYTGLGAQVWSWQLFARLGLERMSSAAALARAVKAADQLAVAVEIDDTFDIFHGMSGAIVPLLRLAEATGEERFAAMARSIGARLVTLADRVGNGVGAQHARWGNVRFPEGIGGYAHGASGIGWALARLSAPDPAPDPDPDPENVQYGETAPDGAAATARAAFAFEESLYDTRDGSWLDLREEGRTGTAWCNGATGIAAVAFDLLPGAVGSDATEPDAAHWRSVIRRAADACWRLGLGWNHTICHGDLGAWETIAQAIGLGLGPAGVDRATLDAHIIGSLEEHGPVSGMARDVFVPSLMSGLGGVAYQLLRMHPECTLPSLLLPDPGGAQPL